MKGEYPDEVTVNSWIDLIWMQRDCDSPRFDEVEFYSVDLASELRGLSRWEKPVYVSIAYHFEWTWFLQPG